MVPDCFTPNSSHYFLILLQLTCGFSSPLVFFLFFFSDPADPMSILLSIGHVLTLQFLYCISFEYFLWRCNNF